MSKNDIPTLWKLLCKRKIQLEYEGGQGYLRCPNGTCWSALKNKTFVKDLFIRQCYEDLYTIWNDSDVDVDLIGGTSGIGKSTFIWYVLFRLMDAFHKDENKDKEQLTFLWVTQIGRMYILYSDGSCDTPKFNALLSKRWPRVDYCFIDMGKAFELPVGLPEVERPKTLVIASFQSERVGLPLLNQAGIDPGDAKTMPIWSKEDIEKVAKSIFGTELDTKRIHVLFLIFGGSLHYCLTGYIRSLQPVTETAQNVHYDHAAAAFVRLLKTSVSLVRDRIPKVAKRLLKSNYIRRLFSNIAPALTGSKHDLVLRAAGSLVTHAISSAPHYTNVKLRISSLFADLYIREHMLVREKKLRQIFSRIGGQPIEGGILEYRGHRILPDITATPTEHFKYLNDGPEIENLFEMESKQEPRRIFALDSIEDVQHVPPSHYGRPTSPNPVGDFIIQPNIIGSFSVSRRHPVKPRTRPQLVALRSQLLEEDESKHVFIYVVHDEATFEKFPLQDGLYTGEDLFATMPEMSQKRKLELLSAEQISRMKFMRQAVMVLPDPPVSV